MNQVETEKAQVQPYTVERRANNDDGNLNPSQTAGTPPAQGNGDCRIRRAPNCCSPTLHTHFEIRLVTIATERDDLIRRHCAGDIDDETVHELERDLDLEQLDAISAKA